MNTKKNLISSALVTLIFAFLLCFIYPMIIWAFSNLIFFKNANGSLIKKGNEIIGSKLIAQDFTKDIYFHPRPSFSSYDGLNSGPSNLAPTSKKLLENIKDLSKKYRDENKLSTDEFVPADAVTYSASGSDPHITYNNAMYQAIRVAEARNIQIDLVKKLIEKHLEKSYFFSRSKVNVLLLNIGLDQNYSQVLQVKSNK